MDHKNFYFIKDTEEIDKLPFEMKHKKRLQLVKDFIKNSKQTKFENISDVHERFVTKRFVDYNKYSIFSHVIFGYMIYNFFLSGKYNLGIIKKSNDVKINSFKFCLSMGLSAILHYRSMNFILYDPYLYDIAIRHY